MTMLEGVLIAWGALNLSVVSLATVSWYRSRLAVRALMLHAGSAQNIPR
jgi:hypothetical protein